MGVAIKKSVCKGAAIFLEENVPGGFAWSLHYTLLLICDPSDGEHTRAGRYIHILVASTEVDAV